MNTALRPIVVKYLWWAARSVLSRHRPKIVAVTGSSGKTTTKVAIAKVLKTIHSVGVAPGNLNSEFGVPLAILGFPGAPRNRWEWATALAATFARALYLVRREKILVLEFATDHPGDVPTLARTLKPEVGIVVSVGAEHYGAFGSLKKVAAEELSVCSHLSEEGTCFVAADLVGYELPSRRSVSIEFFGPARFSQVIPLKLTTGINWKVKSPFLKGELAVRHEHFKFNLPFLGRHFAASVAAAVAVGTHFGVDPSNALKALKGIKLPKGRAELLPRRSSGVVINDCYNANPQSMGAALELLKELSPKHQKVAILGEMRELGRYSRSLHEEIGALAHRVADIVIAIGPQARAYNAAVWFPTPEEALPFILSSVSEDAIVLVKASRGPRPKPYLLPVVEALRES